MKISTIIYLTLCAISPITVQARDMGLNKDYSKYVFVDSFANELPFRMLTPPSLEEGKNYPLVLFLHGYGERGDDNEKQLELGGSIFSNPVNIGKYPAFVVFPQCSEKSWTEKVEQKTFMPGASVPKESKIEQSVMALVRDLVTEHPIDTSRIYIVGISMGGIAAYDLVCRYPDVFAAAIPICGAVNPDRLTDAKDVKFMIFHGGEDEEVPPICGREAYRKLCSVGAAVDYIEFAGIGHDCWTAAFNYPDFLPWLFAQKKDIPIATDGNLTYISE